jgi:hypothetical protein
LIVLAHAPTNMQPAAANGRRCTLVWMGFRKAFNLLTPLRASFRRRRSQLQLSAVLIHAGNEYPFPLWQKSLQLRPKSSLERKGRPMNEVVTSGDRIVC